MPLHNELAVLRQHIEALKVNFPELADDDELRADVFEGETDLNGVLFRLLDMSQDAGATVDVIKIREADLGARKARYQRKKDAARQLMQGLMEDAGLSKVTLPEATLSLSHRKPMPIVTDDTLLPDDCVTVVVTTVRKPDMAAIKNKADAGTMPPGAAMNNGSTSLVIRTK